MIPIQATIVSYSGKPCTLFSAYDPESHVLAISVETEYRADRREGCFVITNDLDISRDALFSEDFLKDSISAFFNMQQGIAADGQSSRLIISDTAIRSNPSQSIEKDGMDANGQRYRLSESITCAQIAALATCWYANSKAGTAIKVMDMMDELMSLNNQKQNNIDDLMRGLIITI